LTAEGTQVTIIWLITHKLLAERFERLLVNRMFDTNDIAAFAELAHVARALWSGTLRGQALTAQKIGEIIGMLRTTVLRKLQYMVTRGYVTQDGSAYVIRNAVLRTTTPIPDQAIKLIIEDRRRFARCPKWTTKELKTIDGYIYLRRRMRATRQLHYN
jgi:hypothetical protein